MRRLLETIGSLLERGEPFVLATVVESAGSAPRAGGAAMVVQSDGSISGTIGGGKIEAETILAARRVLDRKTHECLSFDLSGGTGADLDLICGGRMEVFLEFVDPTPDERNLWEELQRSISSNVPTFLVRSLSGGGADRWVIREGKEIWGSGSCPPEVAEKGRKGRSSEVVVTGGGRYFLQPFRAAGRVILFGAGHVAVEVARLARQVGFEVIVTDDREEFANRRRFPEADDVVVLPSFEECVARFAPDAETYLVIVTRGHRHDRVVLEQSLRSRAGYVGMIGSRSKWGEMSKWLLASGFDDADLRRVHTPIGLPIGSESPEEIAVSIVAELIAVRAGRKMER